MKFRFDVQNLFRRTDLNFMDRDSIEKIRNARISISQLIYVNVISCYVLLYQIKVSYQFQNGKKLFKNAIYDSLL